MIEGDDGDGIFWLQDMAVGRVINKYGFLEAAVHHSQVLQEVSLLKSAVLAVQSMRDVLLFRV